jgi:UMF1 family MFS transporter
MKKKEVFSWAMYDWANSAFSTTVMAGFFPVFFKNYWSEGMDPTLTTARLGTAISVSSLIIAVVSPTLGAMADLHGYKKNFNFLFMCLGALSCFAMGFIDQGQWQWAIFAYGLAMMGFNASSVFYDALLPEVASGREMDYASSLGYSLGYLGGGLLFLLNVLMYLKPEMFGIADPVTAVKISFVTVAAWWFLFTLPLQINVHEARLVKVSQSFVAKTVESLKTLKQTLLDLTQNKNLLTYLVSYWLFIDGVYTVITMAIDFGINIGLESKDLIAALLLTQFIGFPFAWLFGKLTPRWGCRKPILFHLPGVK